MSIFSRPTEELVICSEMRGKLTFQGQPAAGAKIVRWSAWKDHEGESETFYADEHGNFLLPEKREVVKKGRLDFLAQFVAYQSVTVTYESADFEIWYSGKTRPDVNIEYGGETAELRCELTDDPVPSQADGVLRTVACKWELIGE